MQIFKIPSELGLESNNLDETWNKLTQNFKKYMIVSVKKTGAVKKKLILINFSGNERTKIFNTFKSDETKNKKKIEDVMGMFTKFYIPVKSDFFCIYVCVCVRVLSKKSNRWITTFRS